MNRDVAYEYSVMEKLFEIYNRLGYRYEYLAEVKLSDLPVSEWDAIVAWQAFDIAYENITSFLSRMANAQK